MTRSIRILLATLAAFAVASAGPAAAQSTNSAVHLNGSGQYVTMGAAPALSVGGPPGNGYTIECWFFKDGAGTTATSGSGGVTAIPLVCKGVGESENSTVDADYFFGITTGGLLVADFEAYPATGITAGQNYPVTGTNTPIVNSRWYHAAVTYDGPSHTWKLYLDGVQVGTSTPPAGALPRYDSIQHFGVGGALNSTGVRTGGFAGTIDEVRVWNYARSAADIAANRDSQITSASGLVGRYGFDEGTGTATANSVGGTPAGTLTGGATWVAGTPILSDVRPTVTLTAPTDGASVNLPATISLTAVASDSDGTVAKVEFYDGAIKLGEATVAPYAFSWSPLTAGAHVLTAVATDNLGVATTSAGVSVTLVAEPTSPGRSAIRFDGVNDYVTMGAAPTLSVGGPPGNGYTVECWFRKEGTGVTASSGSGGVSAVPLVCKGVGESENSNVDADYFFGIDANGRLVADFEAYPAAGITAGQNYPVIGTNDPIVNNTWYHAAVTYDGPSSTWKLYLNGVLAGTATAPAGALPRYDSIQHFGVGATLNSTGVSAGAFAGTIDEVRVWNYARSAEEITSTMGAELATAAGLVGRYGFNEATGTTTANSVTVDGTPIGTLINGPVWTAGPPFGPIVPPTVTLTAPAGGSTVVFPAPINFAAEASDADGFVARVEFYDGATKVGQAMAPPYAYAWTGAVVGVHTLTAKAFDNNGVSATSTSVSVEMLPNPNKPPVITPGGPADGATGVASTTTLSVGIADPEGDGASVTFYGRKAAPATPGPDFTVATLPDTQFYSESYPATYTAQTQWLIDNRNTANLPNLAFVSHMGDIVNVATVGSQWVAADASMKVIESPVNSLRAYGIPWGGAPGNHDQDPNGQAGPGTTTTTLYNQWFPAARWAGRNYWGGSQSTVNNNNNYQLFSASGLDFIIVHMEYDTRALSFYQPVLDWADALLKAYPNRRAIITSHWIVNTGNPASFSTQGQNIYNTLKNNKNLFLMLCGHVAGEGRRADTFEGRTVYSVLQDYQGRVNGGDGWLRYFVFSPANNTITAKTYRVSNPTNPAAGAYETDADSQFVLSYDMQTPPGEWIPLGTTDVAPGAAAGTLAWTGLEKGASYEWYAVVNDGINSVQTSARRFSTAAAVAPTVTLDAPANGATVPANNVALTASASDSDGNIARVEFFADTVKLGEATVAPYNFTWTGAAAGSYTLTAVAVDNDGLTTLSNAVHLTVAAADTLPPTVALTAPLNGSTLNAGDLTLTATASDSDGSVAKVEFYNGATKLGEDTTSPYAFTWTGVSAGTYTLTARATDAAGHSATSAAVNITVVPVGSGSGFSYTQNFDGLGTSTVLGTPATGTEGWTVLGVLGGGNGSWTDATGIPATGTPSAATAGTANNTLVVDSNAAADTNRLDTGGFNFALSASPTDRALGTSPTGGAGVVLQLTLTNTSSADIAALTIGYDIRRFIATASDNSLPGYRLFYSLNNGTTWTAVTALDPVRSGGTVNVPNTVGVTTVMPTQIALTTAWTAGSALRLRWIDDNDVANSPDQIYGLDNVSIAAVAGNGGTPPSVTITAPASGSNFAAGAVVTLAAAATDTDGVIAKVQFYNGSALLGEDTTAPFSFDWTTPTAPANYTVTAVAIDNDGASTTSVPITVTLTAAGPFSYTQNFDSMGATSTALPAGWMFYTLSGGHDTFSYSPPDTTTFLMSSTTTAIQDGTDSSVLTSNSTLIVATDPTTQKGTQGYNLGLSASSTNRCLGTSPSGNAASELQLTLTNSAGTAITAVNVSYDIRRFTTTTNSNTTPYDSGPYKGIEENPGYWLFYSTDNGTTWTNVPALNPTVSGTSGVVVPNSVGVTSVPVTNIPLNPPWASGGMLLLRWVDDNAESPSPDQIIGLDNVTVSAGSVQVGAAPTVTLTAPLPTDTFSAPATVNLAASASDSDGTIAKVEFYNGGTKLGEDASAPYTYAWTGVAAGSYTVTARAIDNDGNVASSASVAVTVNSGAGSGTLTRGPYLQKAGPTRMTVRWRSSQSVTGRVQYGTAVDTLDKTVNESAPTTEHTIELTGLTANTTYFYSIGSAADTLATGANFVFTTPPVAGTVANTRIWALGDAGTASSSQSAVRDAFYTWTGARKPNLVLQLGDNAYNAGLDTEFQAAVFNMYPTMLRTVPFWSCLGNHETNQATGFVDTYPYFSIYTFPTAGECGGVPSGTEHYYSFDYANVHFISLDSMTASRSPTGAMATWLTNDLASTTATWIICFFHHPPYTKGSHNSDTESELVQMRQNILPILEAGGVDLVLSGHSHCYERSYLLDGHYGLSTTLTSAMKLNAGNGRPAGSGAYIKPLTGPRDHFGAVYSVAGSAGQISGGSLNHPAHFISLNNLGSLVLDINGTRLDATFVQSNGTTPDTFTMIKQGAADSDGDGMSDEYEIANGFDRHNPADAALDTDGDGLTNLQEALAGTNPRDAADKPRVASIAPQADGSVTLQVPTVSGVRYRIEANNAFPTGSWNVVADNLTGNGSVVPVPDAGAVGVTTRIYRVTVLP